MKVGNANVDNKELDYGERIGRKVVKAHAADTIGTMDHRDSLREPVEKAIKVE